MRIHTNAQTFDLYRAVRASGAVAVTLEEHGSRKRARAFEVKLEGDSRRRPNGGQSGAGTGYAATWDQWGIFLAAVFEADPTATCWAYDGADDFHFQTCGRFGAGRPLDEHGDHTFRSVAPYVQECTKCSARKAWATAARLSA